MVHHEYDQKDARPRLVAAPRNGRIWAKVSAISGLAMVVIALVGALLVAERRLSVVETGQSETGRRLDRIEVRIDRISEAVGAKE